MIYLLLFNININDLTSAIDGTDITQYVDDTILNSNTKVLFLRTNEILQRLSIWLQANKVTFDIQKTKYLFIPYLGCFPSLDGSNIQRVFTL